MIKIENVEVMGWEAAIRGMRNPLESWEKSDSAKCLSPGESPDCSSGYCIGPDDLNLMKRLAKAGTSDHRKFMRMIIVYLDITAPLYWWKEFDTYKVGTVANSCSTMHKIAAKEFELDNFSHEHLFYEGLSELVAIIDGLNKYRDIYINGGELVTGPIGNQEIRKFDSKDKGIWWQMIQILPTSYNQKRTVMLNYEVLANMYKSRKNHKLDEWREFCKWIEELPYSELITGKSEEPISQSYTSQNSVDYAAQMLINKDPAIPRAFRRDEIVNMVEDAKALDKRINSHRITVENGMKLLNLLDANRMCLYSFDLNRVTLTDALEAIKEFVSKASLDGIPDIIQENEELRKKSNLQLGC